MTQQPDKAASADMSLPIGIASNAPGAGKSTLASQIARIRGGVVVSFASAIREMLSPLLNNLGINEDHLYRLKDKPIEAFGGKTGRDLLISLGTSWGRERVSSDLWVRAGMRQAQHFGSVVFEDVRFPEEAQAIKAAGGHLVYLIGPENPTGSLAEGKVRPEDCDVVIHNDHTRSPYLLAIDTLYNLYGTTPKDS